MLVADLDKTEENYSGEKSQTDISAWCVLTCTTSRGRPQVSMPELKYHVWVVLRRESGLLSIKGSKLGEVDR